MGFEAKKTEHCGPKRGNGAYWGYKWEAKKESNRIRRENAKREIRDAIIRDGDDADGGMRPNKHRTAAEREPNNTLRAGRTGSRVRGKTAAEKLNEDTIPYPAAKVLEPRRARPLSSFRPAFARPGKRRL
jgi:hypothetical protein